MQQNKLTQPLSNYIQKKKIELKIESFEFEINLFVNANKICKAIRVKLQRKK